MAWASNERRTRRPPTCTCKFMHTAIKSVIKVRASVLLVAIGSWKKREALIIFESLKTCTKNVHQCLANLIIIEPDKYAYMLLACNRFLEPESTRTVRLYMLV